MKKKERSQKSNIKKYALYKGSFKNTCFGKWIINELID